MAPGPRTHQERSTDHEVVARALREQSNRALGIGGTWSAALAAAGLLVTGAAAALTGEQFYLLACLGTVFCLVGSLSVAVSGRRGWVHGWRAWTLMLYFTSLPTQVLLAAQGVLEHGAASFLTGPFGQLYFFVIVVSGFVYSFRLSLACGVSTGLQFLGVFALARPELLLVSTSDPFLYQDLSGSFVAFNKAMMMVFTGATVGAFGVLGRKLLFRVLEEQAHKERIRKLFGQYVSDEVSDLLIEREARSQRAEVVVLFSDLRGFSTFSEGRDPAEVVERLNAYFEAMVGCIRARGGVVDKFVGDAIMAVFGGLHELEDASGAALGAARDMRAALAALNARWAAEGLEPFDNGIGLHRGPVVMGPLGSTERKEFTVIGDAVNTAARIESATKSLGCPVLVTAALFDALAPSGRDGLVDLGEVTVKGKSERIRVFGLPEGS